MATAPAAKHAADLAHVLTMIPNAQPPIAIQELVLLDHVTFIQVAKRVPVALAITAATATLLAIRFPAAKILAAIVLLAVGSAMEFARKRE